MADATIVRRWEIALAGSSLSVEAPAPDTLRIALLPDGAPPHQTWSIDPTPADLAACALAFRETAAHVQLSTPALTVTLSRDAGTLAVARADESVVIEGITLARLDPDPDRDGKTLRWSSILATDARVFGGGERTGPLNKRGRTLTFWATDALPDHDATTDAMYQSVPFLITLTDGLAHGIFFDSSTRATADIGAMASGELAYQTCGTDLVTYLFAGPTLADVLRQFTAITGRMPPLPRWALGNQQSRWSYSSAEEVLAITARYRQERIPCDALHLDIDYMDGYRDFTWNAERFPDPAGIIRSLAEQQMRVVTVVDPGIKVDAQYPVYREGAERGYFVHTAEGDIFEGWVWPGRSAWADFGQSAVVAWWGDLHRELVAAGVAGIWIDMNEPTQADMFAPPDIHIPHGATLPLDTIHHTRYGPVSHAEFHNAYAIEMARATYEGLARLAPQQRPFVLTRAAGAGSQRFAAVWNGDTTSSWEHLGMAVQLNLGVSLSGFAMTGGDIGGFWSDATPALLVRWTQLGALLPLCRNHSAIRTARQEPWAFGEPYTSVCRAAIELRYRLLPYLVTLAHEASRSGAPFLRPLAWIAPRHVPSLMCDTEFLLGDDLLAAPVLEPDAVERRVVLPPGAWYAWQTDELYAGAQEITVPVGLETIPLFVRSGAIVPLASVTQSTEEAPTDPLQLHIYLSHSGQSASAELWDDDDHPQAEQRGTFAQHHIEASWNDDGLLTVAMDRVGGSFRLRYPGVQIQLHLPVGYDAQPLADNAGNMSTQDTFTRRFLVMSRGSY